MKRLLFIFFVLVVGVFFIGYPPTFAKVTQLFYFFPCDTPLSYRIGIVDTRFEISKNEFFIDIQKAATIWSNTEGKNLFVYDPKALLSVNLIFDERQLLNNQINQLQNELQNGKSAMEPEIARYQNLAANFKERLASLNNEIASWNSKGGAPKDVYEKLKSEQEDLKKEADSLNAMAKRLNQSTETYNTEVGQLNSTVNTFNAALQLKPEEGLYNPKEKKIDIYFNTNQDELIHTLAHELGHALGLVHIPDKKAIMYPYTTREIAASDQDVFALQIICQKRSVFEILAKNGPVIFHQLLDKYVDK